MSLTETETLQDVNSLAIFLDGQFLAHFLPLFQNTLFHLHTWHKHHLWRWNRVFQNVST